MQLKRAYIPQPSYIKTLEHKRVTESNTGSCNTRTNKLFQLPFQYTFYAIPENPAPRLLQDKTTILSIKNFKRSPNLNRMHNSPRK